MLKKILASLSLFLLTNISLANNPFQIAYEEQIIQPLPSPKELLATKYGEIIKIVCLIIFIVSIIKVILYKRTLEKEDVDISKIQYKALLFLWLPIIVGFLVVILL